MSCARELSRKEVKQLLAEIKQRYTRMTDEKLIKTAEEWINNPPFAAEEEFKALRSELKKRGSDEKMNTLLFKLPHY